MLKPKYKNPKNYERVPLDEKALALTPEQRKILPHVDIHEDALAKHGLPIVDHVRLRDFQTLIGLNPRQLPTIRLYDDSNQLTAAGNAQLASYSARKNTVYANLFDYNWYGFGQDGLVQRIYHELIHARQKQAEGSVRWYGRELARGATVAAAAGIGVLAAYKTVGFDPGFMALGGIGGLAGGSLAVNYIADHSRYEREAREVQREDPGSLGLKFARVIEIPPPEMRALVLQRNVAT